MFLRVIFFVAAMLFAFAATAGGAVSVRDDSGRELRLAQPATRIISLAPHATELLFAAGAGTRVVAVAAWSDFPPEAAKLPQVGDAHALDIERIVALRPDLVVAWSSGNSASQIAQLEARGIAVFRSDPQHVEEVASNLERLGALAGTDATAALAARRFRKGFAELARSHAGRAPVKLFYEIWGEPLMTFNDKHIVSDVMRLCGARNIFGDSPLLTPTVPVEAVISAAPDLIISGTGAEVLEAWRRWPQIPAVKNAKLCTVDPAHMHRAGPRLLDGARELCGCIDAARGK